MLPRTHCPVCQTMVRLLAMALMGLCLLAQAQTPNSNQPPQRIRPMTTESPSTVAFFYQNPVVLDREQHKGLRLKAGDARFAARSQAVPIVAAEFPEACMEYPIVFSRSADDQWLALALTGLTANANAFVDEQGRWNARYLPASVRRYPFILAEGSNDQLSLAVDMASTHLGKEGQALFDDKGEPSEFVRQVMPMLADFQAQARITADIARKLDEAGLLAPQNLQVRLGDGREAVVEGVWVVDEAKLRQLPDDKILAWFKGGELTVVHAHMLSLRNLVPLLERSRPAPTQANATPQTPKSDGKAKSKAR